MTISYAAQSEIGKGYASRSTVNGKPLEATALQTGLHMIPQDVFEAVMTIHEIHSVPESSSGDPFVAWRSEITGEAEETLRRIGGELLAAFRLREIANYSMAEIRREADAIREASAERNMIGMDL